MRLSRLSCVVCLCLFSVASITLAAEGVEVGDKAPTFTLKDDQGKDWNSADHFGKKTVVIYFYPADMTPGCTKQACAYRDDLGKLKSKNVEVVGISGDSVRNHQLFKQAHNLNFTLLADMEGKAAKAFGVPHTLEEESILRTIANKEETLVRTATTKRWTFIVGPDGLIKLKNDKVNAAEDSQFILDTLADLKD